MQVLNTQTFKEKIFDFEKSKEWKFKGEEPVIIDFYADWCGPCRAQAPILEDLEKAYGGKVKIYKIDTEASPDLAAMFGIRSIPSLLFVPKEGEPAMAAGMMPRESLIRAVKELLAVPEPK